MYATFKNRRFHGFFGGAIDKPSGATRGVHFNYVNLTTEQLADIGRHCNKRDAIAILNDDDTISIVDILSRQAVEHAALLDARELIQVIHNNPNPTPMKSSVITNPATTTTPRRLSTIAHEIGTIWNRQGKGVYFGAVPYLDAMTTLNTMGDYYYQDSAETIVLYLLANASSFRGEDAKRLKAELKAIAKIK